MATESDSNALAGTRVLIVEDEYYLADDLSRAMRRAVHRWSARWAPSPMPSGSSWNCPYVTVV